MLVLYLILYIFLTCSLTLLMSIVSTTVVGWASARTQLGALFLARLHWVWFCVLVSLAGIPPALFFGPKLGLLALLLEQGSLFLGFGLLLGVFFGWIVYFNLSQRALSRYVYSVARPLRFTQVSGVFLGGLFFLSLLLVWGFIFLDDLALLAAWLA